MRRTIIALVGTLLFLLNASPSEAMRPKGDGGGGSNPNQTQCQYIKTVAPSRANVSPYCNVVTKTTQVAHTNNNVQAAGSVDWSSCTPSGTISKWCVGWQSIGDFSTWEIRMGIAATTYWPIGPNGSTHFETYCDIAYATIVKIDMGTCGVLAENSTDYVVGLSYTSTTPAKYGVPATTVGWKTFVRCHKKDGTCDNPITRQPS